MPTPRQQQALSSLLSRIGSVDINPYKQDDLGALIDSGLITEDSSGVDPLTEAGLRNTSYNSPTIVRNIPNYTDTNRQGLSNFMAALQDYTMVPNQYKGSVSNLIDGVLRREGGFVNDPADRGGATNLGITRQAYADFKGIPLNKVTENMIKNLSFSEAKQLYSQNYYHAPGFDKLSATPNIQALVVDTGVHTGPQRATRILQKALNTMGVPVDVDSRLGPQTLEGLQKAVSTHGEARVNNAILEARRQALEAQARSDPSQRRFLGGWRNRLKEFVMDITPNTNPKE